MGALPVMPDAELKKADRPAVVDGSTWCIRTGCGSMFVIINRLDGRIFEVFLKGGKAGGCMTAQTEAMGKLISDQARYGIPIDDEFVIKFKGTTCQEKLEEGLAQSCADAIANAIEMDIKRHKASQPEQLKIDGDKGASDE